MVVGFVSAQSSRTPTFLQLAGVVNQGPACFRRRLGRSPCLHPEHRACCRCSCPQATKFTRWAEERLLTGVPEGCFVTHVASDSEERARRRHTCVVQ